MVASELQAAALPIKVAGPKIELSTCVSAAVTWITFEEPLGVIVNAHVPFS